MKSLSKLGMVLLCRFAADAPSHVGLAMAHHQSLTSKCRLLCRIKKMTAAAWCYPLPNVAMTYQRTDSLSTWSCQPSSDVHRLRFMNSRSASSCSSLLSLIDPVNSEGTTTTTRASTGSTKEDVVSQSSTLPLVSDTERRQLARDKRRQFIGLAKAMDHGPRLPRVTYQPARKDDSSDQICYQALSGLPNRRQLFTVLGIESSCDDTGAAVIRSDGMILGEALASQHNIHEPWGGVVPGLARDAHQATISTIIQDALNKAGMESAAEVDAIGVTVGPGLEICLRVGCIQAQELAMQYQKPFVGVHHLEAHILMARLPIDGSESAQLVEIPATPDVHASQRAMDFPFLALLVSGGHCQLMKCHGIGQYTMIGGTVDDSLGEAFDKTARLLGLPVGGGGGPAIEKLARQGDPNAIPFSVPLHARKDCDFSYSGLKSNVRRTTELMLHEQGLNSVVDLKEQDRANIAASFQHVAIRHVEQRLKRAMDLVEPENIRSLALVGGVAANQELRARVKSLCESRSKPWKCMIPPPRLCTDQGSMSAWAAVERLMVGSSDNPATQQVYARYPFSGSSVTSRNT